MDDDEIDMMLEWEEAAGGAAPDQEEEEFNEDWEALAEVCVWRVWRMYFHVVVVHVTNPSWCGTFRWVWRQSTLHLALLVDERRVP